MANERIRFGGRQTAEGFLFELTGGHRALDLANSVVDRAAAEPRELLASYSDLVSWAQQAGVIDAKDARSLRKEAEAHPVAAGRVLQRAIELRELFFRIFSVSQPRAEDLRELTALQQEASRHRHLSERDGGISWSWDRDRLDDVLWPVVDDAVALLTSDERNRIRTCQGDECRWLFVDNSRQGNRRWCDMTVCGNRAKAKRFYQKAKETKS